MGRKWQCPECNAPLTKSDISGRAVQTDCQCELGRKKTNEINKIIDQEAKQHELNLRRVQEDDEGTEEDTADQCNSDVVQDTEQAVPRSTRRQN